MLKGRRIRRTQAIAPGQCQSHGKSSVASPEAWKMPTSWKATRQKVCLPLGSVNLLRSSLINWKRPIYTSRVNIRLTPKYLTEILRILSDQISRHRKVNLFSIIAHQESDKYESFSLASPTTLTLHCLALFIPFCEGQLSTLGKTHPE